MCYIEALFAGDDFMRTTVNLDDELLAEAERVSEIKERATLVNEGIRALIERESAKRLARLGGSQPGLEAVSRRRSEPA
jgi:Arc/MetJ family transcription regulator